MATNDRWCLIESDPGVFTELIKSFGCKGVQVEEIYALDETLLKELGTIHGLIFLFKWSPGNVFEGPIVDDQAINIFFAKQVINNACATMAIINILFNTNHSDIELGDTLTNLKSFVSSFDSSIKGLSIGNSDVIRGVHNSFSRNNLYEIDTDERSGESYHFVSFVPINGRIYELDGLRDGPVDLGSYSNDNWINCIKPIIEHRMKRFMNDEINFNLMALINDRKIFLQNKIDLLLNKKAELISENKLLNNDDINLRIESTNEEISSFKETLLYEDEKLNNYRIDNIRRKHNYMPFVMEFLKILAKTEQLLPLVRHIMENKNNKNQ